MNRKKFYRGDVVDVTEGHFHKRIRQGHILHQHPKSPQYWFVKFDDRYGKFGKYVTHTKIQLAVNPHID